MLLLHSERTWRQSLSPLGYMTKLWQSIVNERLFSKTRNCLQEETMIAFKFFRSGVAAFDNPSTSLEKLLKSNDSYIVKLERDFVTHWCSESWRRERGNYCSALWYKNERSFDFQEFFRRVPPPLIAPIFDLVHLCGFLCLKGELYEIPPPPRKVHFLPPQRHRAVSRIFQGGNYSQS